MLEPEVKHVALRQKLSLNCVVRQSTKAFTRGGGGEGGGRARTPIQDFIICRMALPVLLDCLSDLE